MQNSATLLMLQQLPKANTPSLGGQPCCAAPKPTFLAAGELALRTLLREGMTALAPALLLLLVRGGEAVPKGWLEREPGESLHMC